MLILTRRPSERLRIGDAITITVLASRGNQVRLGIEAPRDVAIDREEIRERKLREQAGGPLEPRAAIPAESDEP